MESRRFFLLGLLVAALIVAACNPQATPQPTAPPATQPPAPTDTAVPPSTAGDEKEPMGFTEDGAPYRGDPDAPVTLLEFSEFQ